LILEGVIYVPKLKESEELQKDRLARAYIAKNMELYGLSEEQIALKLRCTKRTFQNKRKRPETFTLKEFRKLCAVIKLSDEEKSLIM
jgi:2-phosphoglycerate kinase